MALTNASIAPSFSVNATKLSDPLSIPLSSHTFFPLRPSSSAKNKWDNPPTFFNFYDLGFLFSSVY